MIAAGRWHRYFENVPLLQSMLVPLILWCTTFYAGNFESEQLTRTFFVSYFLSATLCVETFNLDVKVGTSSTTLHVRTLLDTTFLILSCGRCSSGRWLILVRTFCKRAFCIRTYLTAPKKSISSQPVGQRWQENEFSINFVRKKCFEPVQKKNPVSWRSSISLFWQKNVFFSPISEKKNSGASDDFRIPVETKKKFRSLERKKSENYFFLLWQLKFQSEEISLIEQFWNQWNIL